ncbi:MAG TPA: hypothetical protein PLW48_10390 [Alphaproteobacteria bacterium]|nr:hypothetical protein [Alphaproteobacteria bacterium]HCS23821.1 hypothetical protein [Rhodospirillaceae bacterium]HRI76896.1 hypothetical protein [Alphaproteobacteria bacterium]HRJ67534.1 hypothetical protein [Alphaproteobacteria bacterium]
MSKNNRKQTDELTALRDKLNKATRKKDYYTVVEACLEIIALEQRTKNLGIIAPLYHKDLGEGYLKLLEYEKAVESLNTAREGLIKYRATHKLKYPEDWLAEIYAIEKLIHRIEKTHLR